MVGLVILIPAVVMAIIWAKGIASMHKNHPEYKGEDFLDWDDNKNHTEGDF